MCFGVEDHRGKVPFSLCCIRGTYYWYTFTVGIDLDHLAEVRWCLLGFSTVKLLSFPPSFHVPGSHYAQSTLKRWEIMLYFLEGGVLYKLFGMHGWFACSPHLFNYLFIQLFIYIRMDSWLLILYSGLLSNATLFCLLKWFQFWSFGALSIDSWVPLT